MGLFFWGELIQAMTMVPVFLVHLVQCQQSTAWVQPWVGMAHSVVSYMLHFNIWWQQELWPTGTTILYALDKSMIMFMALGFHYYFEPKTGKIMVVPCFLGASQIMLYQHHYIGTRCAYFDIFLLGYIVFVWVMFSSEFRNRLVYVLLLLCIIGYGLEVPGLMHLSLAPSFSLCYHEIRKKNKTLWAQ